MVAQGLKNLGIVKKDLNCTVIFSQIAIDSKHFQTP